MKFQFCFSAEHRAKLGENPFKKNETGNFEKLSDPKIIQFNSVVNGMVEVNIFPIPPIKNRAIRLNDRPRLTQHRPGTALSKPQFVVQV